MNSELRKLVYDLGVKRAYFNNINKSELLRNKCNNEYQGMYNALRCIDANLAHEVHNLYLETYGAWIKFFEDYEK